MKFELRYLGRAIGIGAAIIYLKEVLLYNHYEISEKMNDKTFIITGANSGIGYSCAMQAAGTGATVIMACRNVGECRERRPRIIEKTGNKEVFCWQCDLSSQDSIRQFAASVYELCPKVDYLINNAGVMHCPQSYTNEGIETQFGTNYLGHFLLTRLLLKKLKESTPSRIVNVVHPSYVDGHINFDDLNSTEYYDKEAAFNQSQLAKMFFTKELTNRLHGSGISAHAVYPGRTFTNITRHTDFEGTLNAFTYPFKYFALRTPWQSATSLLFAATSPTLNDMSGLYIDDQDSSAIALKDVPRISSRLWKTSELWTNLPVS